MANTRLKLNRQKFIEIMNKSPKMDAYLDSKADEAETLAKDVYEIRSQHQDVHVPEYKHSFFVKRRKALSKRGDVVNSRIIGNSSGRWYWVEFGAHAGGKTPVLNYRVLGTTLDILSSR